jgi:hypothetical protein
VQAIVHATGLYADDVAFGHFMEDSMGIHVTQMDTFYNEIIRFEGQEMYTYGLKYPIGYASHTHANDKNITSAMIVAYHLRIGNQAGIPGFEGSVDGKFVHELHRRVSRSSEGLPICSENTNIEWCF